jgi:Leucine-rich repeat (LRR) protein
MEQLLPVLTSVSNETELMNATSPQGAALAWMVSQDLLSPIENESRTTRETELMIQRYTLAVFYYSTMGDNWFASDGWLDGKREECTWEYLDCINKDIVSIDTGARNNLVGAIPLELKELKELRSLILPSNALTGFSKGLGSLQSLVELDLSRNNMGGTLPVEIYQLTTL